MNNLYIKIESLCKSAGINITEMCRAASVPRGNLTDLKKGRQNSLSAPNLIKIATYFGISMEDLLGKEAQKNKPPVQMDEELLDEKLVKMLLDLSPEEVQEVLQFVEFLKAKRKA